MSRNDRPMTLNKSLSILLLVLFPSRSSLCRISGILVGNLDVNSECSFPLSVQYFIVGFMIVINLDRSRGGDLDRPKG